MTSPKTELTATRPTIRPLDEVITAFNNLSRPIENNTALNDFLTTYFVEAGSELEAVPPDQLETQPDFLDNVNSSTIADFVSQVIDIWPDLTRRYVGGGNCTGCVDSFLPLNRTFVVAGGRFREPYYWDSFWIIEGLLRTQGSFVEIAYNIIENFLDFVEEYVTLWYEVLDKLSSGMPRGVPFRKSVKRLCSTLLSPLRGPSTDFAPPHSGMVSSRMVPGCTT